MALSRRKFLLRYRTKVVDTFGRSTYSLLRWTTEPNSSRFEGLRGKKRNYSYVFSAKWQRNASIIKQCWKQPSSIKTITRARSRSTTKATWNVILWQPKWRTLMVFIGWRPITGVKCRRCASELRTWQEFVGLLLWWSLAFWPWLGGCWMQSNW